MSEKTFHKKAKANAEQNAIITITQAVLGKSGFQGVFDILLESNEGAERVVSALKFARENLETYEESVK